MGDVNFDGRVDAIDLNVVGSNWQTSVTGWASGDLNGDKFVDSVDLNILGRHWNASTTELAGAPANVPEPNPAGWFWIASAVVILAHRKRKTQNYFAP